MFYLKGYERDICLERECKTCVERIECIHYTPEEEYPPQEEYRLFTPLDDTSGELLRNITKKISRLGYPEREIYKLVLAWYLLGYQVKDLLKLISRGVHPLEIERIIFGLLKDEFRAYIAELVEHGVLKALETDDIEVDDTDLEWIDFLIELRVKNFTGEVRLGPPEDPEEMEEGETPLPPETRKLIDEAFRLASSVKSARSGKLAYHFSQRCKQIVSQLPPDWAEVVRRRLKRAWEERKSSHAKK